MRRPGKCQNSNLRVVKTIRVRKEDLDSWIGKSDIKARSDMEMNTDQLEYATTRWSTWSETLGPFSHLEL